VDAVEPRDKQGDSQDDQQDVSQQEVRTPKRHLDDLDDIFTGRLGNRGGSKAAAVPLTSPPSPVGFIVLELTGQEDRNKNLLNGSLDCDDGDDTEDGVGSIPELQEPEELEKCNDANECGEMGKRGHVRSELLPLGENWSKEQGDEEEGDEHGGVPNDGADCDEGDPDKWAWGLVSVVIGEGFEEHVGDHEDSR